MLILSRKPGQRIVIGDGIEICFLSVSGNKMKVGISAPTDTPVHRGEVYEAIKRDEAAEAARAAGEHPAETS